MYLATSDFLAKKYTVELTTVGQDVSTNIKVTETTGKAEITTTIPTTTETANIETTNTMIQTESLTTATQTEKELFSTTAMPTKTEIETTKTANTTTEKQTTKSSQSEITTNIENKDKTISSRTFSATQKIKTTNNTPTTPLTTPQSNNSRIEQCPLYFKPIQREITPTQQQRLNTMVQTCRTIEHNQCLQLPPIRNDNALFTKNYKVKFYA